MSRANMRHGKGQVLGAVCHSPDVHRLHVDVHHSEERAVCRVSVKSRGWAMTGGMAWGYYTYQTHEMRVRSTLEARASSLVVACSSASSITFPGLPPPLLKLVHRVSTWCQRYPRIACAHT